MFGPGEILWMISEALSPRVVLGIGLIVFGLIVWGVWYAGQD